MSIDPEKLLATPPAEMPFSYDARDTMLHALGVGVGMDAADAKQLPFVYEDGAPLLAFPTLSTVLGWVDMVRDPRFANPGAGIDANRMVVGELAFENRTPLPVSGTGIARSYFAEIVDKGAGRAALVRVRKDVSIGNGDVSATLDTWMYVRDAGGFGGSAAGAPERIEMPNRSPDAVGDMATPPNLALLYRLSLRDHNALHADPAHAKRVGFARPILHGIANFSVAVHAVLRETLDYDARRVKGGRVRMSGPVFPGDTVRTEMWNEGTEILFRARALERDTPVMDGGRVLVTGRGA